MDIPDNVRDTITMTTMMTIEKEKKKKKKKTTTMTMMTTMTTSRTVEKKKEMVVQKCIGIGHLPKKAPLPVVSFSTT